MSLPYHTVGDLLTYAIELHLETRDGFTTLQKEISKMSAALDHLNASVNSALAEISVLLKDYHDAVSAQVVGEPSADVEAAAGRLDAAVAAAQAAVAPVVAPVVAPASDVPAVTPSDAAPAVT